MKKSISKIILLIICSTVMLGFNSVIVLAALDAGDGVIKHVTETMVVAPGGKYQLPGDSKIYNSYGTIDLSDLIGDSAVIIKVLSASKTNKNLVTENFASNAVDVTIPARPAAPMVGASNNFVYDPTGGTSTKGAFKNVHTSADLEIKGDEKYSSWIPVAKNNGIIDIGNFKVVGTFQVRKAAVEGTSFASKTVTYTLPLDLEVPEDAVEFDYEKQKVTIYKDELPDGGQDFSMLEWATYTNNTIEDNDDISGESSFPAFAPLSGSGDSITIDLDVLSAQASSQGKSYINFYIRYSAITDTLKPRKQSEVLMSGDFNEVPAEPEVDTDYTIKYSTETIDLANLGDYALYSYNIISENSTFIDVPNTGKIPITDLLDSTSTPKVYLRLKEVATVAQTPGTPASKVAEISLNPRPMLTLNERINYEEEILSLSDNTTDNKYYYTAVIGDAGKATAGGSVTEVADTELSLTATLDNSSVDTLYFVRQANDNLARPKSKVFELTGLTRSETPIINNHFRVDNELQTITLLKNDGKEYAFKTATTANGSKDFSTGTSTLVLNTASSPITVFGTTTTDPANNDGNDTVKDEAYATVKILGDTQAKTFPSSVSAIITFTKPAAPPENATDFQINYSTEKILKIGLSTRGIEFKKATDPVTSYKTFDTTGTSIGDLFDDTDTTPINVRFKKDTLPASEPATISLAARKATPAVNVTYKIDYRAEELQSLGKTLEISETDKFTSLEEVTTGSAFDIKNILSSTNEITYYIREKADATAPASKPATVLFVTRYNVPDDVSLDVAAGTIQNTTANMEYIISSSTVNDLDDPAGSSSCSAGTTPITMSAGDLYVRIKADDNKAKSIWKKLTTEAIVATPAAPTSSNSDFAIDYDKEELENTSSYTATPMEYSTNGKNYIVINPTTKKLSLRSIIQDYGRADLTLYLRFGAANSSSQPSESTTVTLKARPETPTLTVDSLKEQLNTTANATGLQLSIDSGNWSDVTSNDSGVILNSGTAVSTTGSTNFALRVKHNLTNGTFASKEATATAKAKDNQASPTGVYVNQKTGTISPVNDKMEYKIDSGDYISVSGDTITIPLTNSNQTVSVRYKATSTANASPDLDLTVSAKESSDDLAAFFATEGVKFIWAGKYWTIGVDSSVNPTSSTVITMSSYEISKDGNSYKAYNLTNLKSTMGSDYSDQGAMGSLYIRRRATGTAPASEPAILEYPAS